MQSEFSVRYYSYGETKEPVDNYPAEAFKQNCPSSCEVVIVPYCDHFYVGAEDRVATIVSDWLSRTLD